MAQWNFWYVLAALAIVLAVVLAKKPDFAPVPEQVTRPDPEKAAIAQESAVLRELLASAKEEVSKINELTARTQELIRLLELRAAGIKEPLAKYSTLEFEFLYPSPWGSAVKNQESRTIRDIEIVSNTYRFSENDFSKVFLVNNNLGLLWVSYLYGNIIENKGPMVVNLRTFCTYLLKYPPALSMRIVSCAESEGLVTAEFVSRDELSTTAERLEFVVFKEIYQESAPERFAGIMGTVTESSPGAGIIKDLKKEMKDLILSARIK